MEVRAAESGGQSAGGGKAGCPVAALSAFGGKGDLPDQAARVGRKYARRGQSAEFVRTAYASDPQRESAYEFGRLVRLDEVEHGIVSGYKILEGNAADTNSWMPALDQHQACFGHLPQMATADRGFFPPRTRARPRPGESRRWRCRRVGVCRGSARNGRNSVGSNELCAGELAVKRPSAR